MSPLQGWGCFLGVALCTQGVALGYRIWPLWGRVMEAGSGNVGQVMGGEFHHNALGLTRSVVLSTNGASWESPGCNPGYALVRWVCIILSSSPEGAS